MQTQMVLQKTFLYYFILVVSLYFSLDFFRLLQVAMTCPSKTLADDQYIKCQLGTLKPFEGLIDYGVTWPQSNRIVSLHTPEL